MARKSNKCEWLGLREALRVFAEAKGTQSAEHIKPLHWYVACRLVIEGGFHPDDVRPRPPFDATQRSGKWFLEHNAGSGSGGEQTVFGGLKTKNVDVVVTKRDIGPVIAVSIKGTFKAFRNLTNRMEEAVGDCSNLHIAYPALVYGFLHVLRANREDKGAERNDTALLGNGDVADSIVRYHDVLARLTGRGDLRNEVSRYEAVALALVNPYESAVGSLVTSFPENNSILLSDRFFPALYQQYDLRFVYAAPSLVRTTRRIEWDPGSPALQSMPSDDYRARVAAAE